MKLLPNNTTQVANFNSDNKIIKFKIDCINITNGGFFSKWGLYTSCGYA